VRVVEKSNWMGKALMAPRTRYKDLRARADLDGPSVYLLAGPAKSSVPTVRIYIGETDDLPGLLDSHDKTKDFWNWGHRLHQQGRQPQQCPHPVHRGTADFAGERAVMVLLGRTSNGRVEWKSSDGRTLKEPQTADVPAVADE
jgi:hypothetical protein